MLWQIYVFPRPEQPDLQAQRIAGEIEELDVAPVDEVHFARGYLIEGELARSDAERIGRELLADPVIEMFSLNDDPPQISAPHSAAARYSVLSTQYSVRTADHSPQPRRAAEALDTQSCVIANVLLKPGVMDPVAQSVQQAISQLGLLVNEVHTFRRYSIVGLDGSDQYERIASRVLANTAIEQVIWGPLELDHLPHGSTYRLELIRIPIRTMTDSELERVSRQGQLSLSLVEMQTIRRHFREIGRDPTDAELETLAQTWSEHCSHKTLRGRIDYEELDGNGQVVRREHFENLLKETIFHATQKIRQAWGPEHDWCVSVFEDNAGVVRFDDTYNVCFKVETHNHPSAIEPYGGANTGLGGVLRDSMGTGLGAKPIANTDVFCFAPPDFPADRLPPGVLHPKRVMRGVVAGVRDYGNRMGIPTVNGAIYFDERYLGNPLVFCGSVGLIPRKRSKKEPKAGDLIVAVGGRTGRDGIHGATFSSIELTHKSESLSGGAVQIGNAITEKMMLDVILQARDRGLYHAITDCGAGGFSSAVGEMGEKLGAVVWLDRVPLKYQGLSYTEIWISEAQERMVLAVAETHWSEFDKLATSEGVEATVIGRFEHTGRLVLKYDGQVVGDLDLCFLHEGRPPVVRKAVYRKAGEQGRGKAGEQGSRGAGESAGADVGLKISPAPPFPLSPAPQLPSPPAPQLPRSPAALEPPYNETLRRILSSWNVCSKEWVIRQYDHEVQGGSVVKPLVGAANDGPSDAAVIRPVLGSYRGLAIACGMNPRYGDLDPYWMAASAIDEAIRNCVAVGADPDRIAILDNFCWGNTDRPEELGSLVRAAIACRDMAIAYGTPFISGKDSLNNEFVVNAEGGDGIADLKSQISNPNRIVIPPTLLISAIGQIDDVRQCVTMDLKEPGNELYLVGVSRNELGGSHFYLVSGEQSGFVPNVDPRLGREIFRRLHLAIRLGLVVSCHDVSEGGLAAALAEMAIAGGLGARIDLSAEYESGRRRAERASGLVQATPDKIDLLFSESNSRFLVEVPPGERVFNFLTAMESPRDLTGAPGDIPWLDLEIPVRWLGNVTSAPTLLVTDGNLLSPIDEDVLIEDTLEKLKECWQRPLRW